MKKFYFFAVVFFFIGVSVSAQDSDPAAGFITETSKPVPDQEADPAAGFITEANKPAPAQDSDPAAGFITGTDRPVYYTLDTEKLNIGISLNPAGFIPYVGNGLTVSADFTKGKFNTIIDIHSGFGVFPRSVMYNFHGYEYFGISSSFNYFHSGRIGGFYAGIMLEYSVGRFGSDMNYGMYDDEGNYHGVQYETSRRIGLAGNIGYKFVTSSGVYFRTGLAGGWSFGKNFRKEFGLIARPDLSVGYNFRVKARK